MSGCIHARVLLLAGRSQGILDFNKKASESTNPGFIHLPPGFTTKMLLSNLRRAALSSKGVETVQLEAPAADVADSWFQLLELLLLSPNFKKIVANVMTKDDASKTSAAAASMPAAAEAAAAQARSHALLRLVLQVRNLCMVYESTMLIARLAIQCLSLLKSV